MRFVRPVLWLMAISCTLPGVVMAQGNPLDLGISLPPSLNFATSPNPVGSGARAAGKGFAFIAVADDATAASWNPGGLTQLQQPGFSIVGSYVLRLEDQEVTQPGVAIDGQTIDSLNLNYLSVVYPFEFLRRNVVVSLNVQRLFDLHGQTDVISEFTTLDGVQRVSANQDGGLWTISPGRGRADHARLLRRRGVQYLARSLRQRLETGRHGAGLRVCGQRAECRAVSLPRPHRRGV